MITLGLRLVLDTQTLWEKWGQWFAGERRLRKLTQAEVSQSAGIERTHLSDIENGKTGSKRETVRKLMLAIQGDVEEGLRRAGWLATGSEEYQRSPTSEGDRLRDKPIGEHSEETMTEEEAQRLIFLFARKPRQARQTAEASIKAILAEFPDLDTEPDRETASVPMLEEATEPPRLDKRLLAVDLDDGKLYAPDGTQVSAAQQTALVPLLGALTGIWGLPQYSESELAEVLSNLRAVFQLTDTYAMPLPGYAPPTSIEI